MAGDPSGRECGVLVRRRGADGFASRPIRSAIQAPNFPSGSTTPAAAVFPHPHRGRLQVRRRRRAMPALFPRSEPRLFAFSRRLQARPNGPCRGRERRGDADEQGYFARRLHPQASIGNVGLTSRLTWRDRRLRRSPARERALAPAARDGCSNRTAARARSSPTDFAWLRGPKRRPPENAGARGPSPS